MQKRPPSSGPFLRDPRWPRAVDGGSSRQQHGDSARRAFTDPSRAAFVPARRPAPLCVGWSHRPAPVAPAPDISRFSFRVLRDRSLKACQHFHRLYKTMKTRKYSVPFCDSILFRLEPDNKARPAPKLNRPVADKKFSPLDCFGVGGANHGLEPYKVPVKPNGVSSIFWHQFDPVLDTQLTRTLTERLCISEHRSNSKAPPDESQARLFFGYRSAPVRTAQSGRCPAMAVAFLKRAPAAVSSSSSLPPASAVRRA
jgi:hypothetical protein